MRMKPTASDAGISKDNLILRCQDCLHYSGTRSPIYDSACKNRGVLPSAVAPHCYTPNISVFRPLGIDFYNTLSALTANLPISTVRVLAGVLKVAPKLKAQGLSLFQKVYFHVGNKKYLSNWFTGYVVAPGAVPTLFLVAGSLKRSTRVITAIIDVGSMISHDKFVELRTGMIAKGNLVDPENLRTKFKPVNSKAAEYEPPTIDKINEDLVASKRLEEKSNKHIKVVRANKKLIPATLTPKTKKDRQKQEHNSTVFVLGPDPQNAEKPKLTKAKLKGKRKEETPKRVVKKIHKKELRAT